MSGPTFVLEVWRSLALYEWCIANVRTAYPESRIIVFSDGDPAPEYRRLAAPHGAEVTYGERLWGEGNAGPLWLRRLRSFAERPTDYLVKIDTDTGIYRPLRWLPEGDCLFGTVWETSFVTGGFIGISRGAALRILESGALDDETLRSFNLPSATPPINTEDRAISWVATRLGIPLVDHPEVASRWKVRTPNPDLKYAVVHPCKDGKL